MRQGPTRWNHLTRREVVGFVVAFVVLAVVGTIWVARSLADVDVDIGIDENDEANRLPVAGASTCEELVADPLFGEQAELAVSLATPAGSPPNRCTLAVDGDAPVLDTLGIDTTCQAGTSVPVAATRDGSGAWWVDQEQTRQLDADGCLSSP